MWRKWLVPMIATTSLLLVSGTVADPISAAEEAVLIPGATVFKRINPFYPLIALSYPYIGINLHDDEHPQVVDYSQEALATDRALLDGVEKADIAVRAIDGKVVVIGESMGSMVAARLAAELADSADPPSPNDIRFVLIASPEEGVAQYFREGTHIPLLNYTVRRVPISPYPTTVVIGEYDPWADPPDRPWNLVSVANAAMGLIYVHGPASWDVDLSDVPPENVTVDGTVTTYFVPTEHLPLTRPFRDLGIPDCVVDVADQVLRPIIDAGYRRHDQPGDTRPFLSDGELHRDVPGTEQTLEQSREETGGDIEQSEDPGQQRQTGGDDRPEPDAQESKDDPDAQESEGDPDAQESKGDTAERQAVGE